MDYFTGPSSSIPFTEVLNSHNSLSPRKPFRIPLEELHSTPLLQPGASTTLPITIHAETVGSELALPLLFVYRTVRLRRLRPLSSLIRDDDLGRRR
jgi:hypothetical protein